MPQSESLPEPGLDKLDRILAAIVTTRESLETKVDSVAVGLNLLRDDHRKLTYRVSQSEKDITELKPAVVEVQKAVIDLTGRIRYLEGRAEDAEGRNRRSNLLIVGLPEEMEGRDPLSFLEDWIKSFMPKDSLTPFFSLERAHRVPGQPPPQGGPASSNVGQIIALPGPRCYTLHI